MHGGAGVRRGGLTAVLLIVMVAFLASAAGAETVATTTTSSTTTTTTTTPESVDEGATPTTPTTSTTTPMVEPDADPTVELDRDAWLAADGDDVGVTAGTYTVTPSTGLGYSESVVIDGTGYAPSSVFGALQCITGATGLEGCNTGSLVVHGTDGSGNVSFSIPVRRFFSVDGGATFVDCADAPGTCIVGAGPSLAASLLDPTPLTFDSGAPIPPAPVLVVTPDIDLGLVTEVSITGTGFVANQFVGIRQCVVGGSQEDCDWFGGTNAFADGAGAIAIAVEVRRGMRISNGPVVDCLDPPGCELVAVSHVDPFLVAYAPLDFDPSIPVPPPLAVVATPSTGLADHAFVTVSASGFAPHDAVVVGQCVAGADPFVTCPSSRVVEADDSGAVEATFRVRRFIGSPVVDCASSPGACVASAFSLHDVFASGTAPLEFDPNALPPPPPIVTVVPSTGLRDGDTVTVAGSGFTPRTSVGMVECVRSLPILDGCALSETLTFVTTDSAGGIQATFRVRRTIRTQNGNVDCAADPRGCVLIVAAAQDEFERVDVPLQFAPDPVETPGGLPRTGAPSVPLAALGGGLCLVGALFLVGVRTRARTAIEWHPERDTTS